MQMTCPTCGKPKVSQEGPTTTDYGIVWFSCADGHRWNSSYKPGLAEKLAAADPKTTSVRRPTDSSFKIVEQGHGLLLEWSEHLPPILPGEGQAIGVEGKPYIVLSIAHSFALDAHQVTLTVKKPKPVAV